MRFAFCVSCLFELRFWVVGFWFWIVVFTWCLGVGFVVGIFFGAWLLFWLWALVDVFVHSTTTLHRISCDIMWFHGFSWDLMDAHMKHL